MKLDRRDFLRHGFTTIGGMTLLAQFIPSFSRAEEQRGSPGAISKDTKAISALPMVKPGEAAAVAVNYVAKHSDIKDSALKVERMGVPFEKQFCSNCMLFTKDGAGDAGKCPIFANQQVAGAAWCSSWAKKP